MTPELDAVGQAFLANKVPAMWMKASYPSLKPLSGYVLDLLKRLKLFNDWIKNGPPVLFWISGIFFTQAFFTGLMQNFARKTKYPIDMCVWNFYFKKADFVADKAPEYGCFFDGLFMEGARWDNELMAISESLPKVLYCSMPIINLHPCLNTEDATPAKIYLSPTYKTSERRGTLSTTGHSTNFIMMIAIPIQEQHSEQYWNVRGCALLSQLDD